MLCVIPFFSGDKDQAVRLANWIRDLGGVKNHDCLLVVDKSTDAEGVLGSLSEAFRSVKIESSTPEGAQGVWGTGTTNAEAANVMFRTGATYVFHRLKVPFFWLEPDAAPTRPTWLDEIEAEYKAAGKPFMGMLVDMPPHERHMSGVGCYPFDVANHSLPMMNPFQREEAWDYAGRKDTVGKEKAHFTDLIQHVYRINGNVPEWPTFPTAESLAQIHPRAAVFHRCKSPDLIDRLRERYLGEDSTGGQSRAASVVVQSDPPPPSREQELEARVKELEALVSQFGELGAKVPAPVAVVARKSISKKPKRTPEQQAAINERMAKARAGRGKKLTGVK